MKKSLLATIASMLGLAKQTRIKFRDSYTAFQFRMGAGFPGDVNRTHPASIEPVLIDASAPPQFYGEAVLVDATTQGVRPFTVGDEALTHAYGVLVRPYPFQQSSGGMTSSFGAATPPQSGYADVLRSGYIMVSIPADHTQPVKGGQVFIWTAASTGTHIQGGFEAASSGGNTASLDANLYTFNGVPDANGVVEICFNV